MKIMKVVLVVAALTVGLAAPASAAPKTCTGEGVDATAMRQAMSGLPDAAATSAQVRVTGARGC